MASKNRSGQAGSLAEVYGYDEAGQLATINAAPLSYDPNGNRLSGANRGTFTYRADNSIATGPGPNGTGTETCLYEPWGGVTRDACRTYSYDGFDRAWHTNVRQTLDLLPRCNIADEQVNAAKGPTLGSSSSWLAAVFVPETWVGRRPDPGAEADAGLITPPALRLAVIPTRPAYRPAGG